MNENLEDSDSADTPFWADGGEGSTQLILYDSSGAMDGHQGEYAALLQRLIGARRSGSFWLALWDCRPVLVAAVEASLPRYVLLCLLRALRGKRTAGFLFRPLPAIIGYTLRLRLKRLVLMALRRMPGVTTLTLLPFSVEPRFAQIAHAGLYDPQLWDLHYPTPLAQTHVEGGLAAEIRQAAGERRICCAIGRQDADKGFDQFAGLFAARPELQDYWLFAFGGRVATDQAGLLQAFVRAGGIGRDRFVDRAELFDLYSCADLIWCSYAADYDQASGVLGRAIQLGIPVVVRQNALIHSYCVTEAVAHVAYDGTSGSFPVTGLPLSLPDFAHIAARAQAQGAESLEILRAALGLDQQGRG